MSPNERFWSKVDVRGAGDCWEWQAAMNHRGYGLFRFENRLQAAHRVSFVFATGTRPGNLFVCHTCDNRACVNPAHLWLGTAADNTRDMIQKGRAVSGTRGRSIGRKLTLANIAEIRADGRSGRAVAKDFGVSHVTVHRIRTGKMWANADAATVGKQHSKASGFSPVSRNAGPRTARPSAHLSHPFRPA